MNPSLATSNWPGECGPSLAWPGECGPSLSWPGEGCDRAGSKHYLLLLSLDWLAQVNCRH